MDKTIDELCKERDRLYDKILEINQQISEKEIEGLNFQGKYVYSKTYGYMYVTWQKHDKSIDGNGRGKMFFQGLSFKGSFSEYKDDSYFTYDALEEWNIPFFVFISEVKSGQFIEITKEEFMSKAEMLYCGILANLNKHLEKIEKENENNT